MARVRAQHGEQLHRLRRLSARSGRRSAGLQRGLQQLRAELHPPSAAVVCAAAQAASGVNCGFISNGCGGIVDCDNVPGFGCPNGESCGVRGIAESLRPAGDARRVPCPRADVREHHEQLHGAHRPLRRLRHGSGLQLERRLRGALRGEDLRHRLPDGGVRHLPRRLRQHHHVRQLPGRRLRPDHRHVLPGQAVRRRLRRAVRNGAAERLRAEHRLLRLRRRDLHRRRRRRGAASQRDDGRVLHARTRRRTTRARTSAGRTSRTGAATR